MRFKANPGDRYLLLLANTEYIRESYLALACYDGQTPIANKLPAELQLDLNNYPRWNPPGTARGALVDWYGAVGPGSKYSVWFDEDDEGAEATPSACG